MALSKETVVDKIEVLESNAIQVRSATRVLEDAKCCLLPITAMCCNLVMI